MSDTAALTDITGDYTLDTSHSRLGFSARHAVVTKVRGQFAEWSATAHVDTANPAASSVTVTINPASVTTGSADRDGHLVSADFFDVENFPEWKFVSTEVSRNGADWTVTGDLTIKDVTKPVTIVFEHSGSARDPFGKLLAIGLSGAFGVGTSQTMFHKSSDGRLTPTLAATEDEYAGLAAALERAGAGLIQFVIEYDDDWEDQPGQGPFYQWGLGVPVPRLAVVDPETCPIDPQERLFLQHAWMAVGTPPFNRAMAEARGVSAGELYGSLQKSNRQAELERGLTEEKAYQFLLGQSTVDEATS